MGSDSDFSQFKILISGKYPSYSHGIFTPDEK